MIHCLWDWSRQVSNVPRDIVYQCTWNNFLVGMNWPRCDHLGCLTCGKHWYIGILNVSKWTQFCGLFLFYLCNTSSGSLATQLCHWPIFKLNTVDIAQEVSEYQDNEMHGEWRTGWQVPCYRSTIGTVLTVQVLFFYRHNQLYCGVCKMMGVLSDTQFYILQAFNCLCNS